MASPTSNSRCWGTWLGRLVRALGLTAGLDWADNEMAGGPGRAMVSDAAASEATQRPGRAGLAELAAELARCRRAGISQQDWQRLRFVRWRYRQGRLTEWPDTAADCAPARESGGGHDPARFGPRAAS